MLSINVAPKHPFVAHGGIGVRLPRWRVTLGCSCRALKATAAGAPNLSFTNGSSNRAGGAISCDVTRTYSRRGGNVCTLGYDIWRRARLFEWRV
jgi:hypothetical protein